MQTALDRRLQRLYNGRRSGTTLAMCPSCCWAREV
jgi:hypothetical protein